MKAEKGSTVTSSQLSVTHERTPRVSEADYGATHTKHKAIQQSNTKHSTIIAHFRILHSSLLIAVLVIA